MGSDMTHAALSPLIAGVPRILGAAIAEARNGNVAQGSFRVLPGSMSIPGKKQRAPRECRGTRLLYDGTH
jgi:hypothetical protein